MPTLTTAVVHGTRTARSNYQYQFTPKHHGADVNAAQWLLGLRMEEEFSVFDQADMHELSDQDGNLYGVLRGEEGNLLYIGTWHQQVAEFPVARAGEAWHGYPLYPLVDLGPENRRGEKGRPAKSLFDRMAHAGLISRRDRRRLLKGDHA
ncbi:MAG TPA: hypothetical protein VK395_30830 [Gemmataceae bacterium]|nr:hypothetical protein [Gemmataceae bacterium]